MIKNTNLQLIQYKTLHRTHLTGWKLFLMGFTSDICPHCTQNCPDTYVHAFWHCIPIKQFWENITGLLSTFLGCYFLTSPSLCLLGDTSTINLNNLNCKVLLITLAVAKKTILMNWNTKKKIHTAIWKNLLIDHISLETSHCSSGKDSQDSISLWSSFSKFLQS